MTPAEFKAARLKLGLNKAELGRILNTTKRTVGKWEADDAKSTSRAPNPIAVRVLEWMLDGYRPPEWPESPSGGGEQTGRRPLSALQTKEQKMSPEVVVLKSLESLATEAALTGDHEKAANLSNLADDLEEVLPDIKAEIIRLYGEQK